MVLRMLPFVVLFLVFLGLSSSALAAGECPAHISADPSSPIAYMNRGDRCEGLFRQQVAAPAQLSLIGVHRHVPAFTPGSGKFLTIATPANIKGGATLSIRILSSRPRQYYRMDATLQSGSRFIWKRDIIDNPAVKLGPTDVKALLCESSCSVPEPKIFPASIVETKAPQSQGITLWFRAAVDLRKLFVTLRRVQGPSGGEFEDTDVLSGRLLPAGAAKDVFAVLKSGAYTLKATAVPAGAQAMDEVRAQITVP
jgi:hypothetical protein